MEIVPVAQMVWGGRPPDMGKRLGVDRLKGVSTRECRAPRVWSFVGDCARTYQGPCAQYAGTVSGNVTTYVPFLPFFPSPGQQLSTQRVTPVVFFAAGSTDESFLAGA